MKPQAHEHDHEKDAAPQLGDADKAVQAGRPGETHWSQASGDGLQREAPKQFSEIDQSASSQAAASASMEAVGMQAFEDATQGVDTDRGPVMDAVYNGAVTEGHRTGDEEEVHGRREPHKSTASRTR